MFLGECGCSGGPGLPERVGSGDFILLPLGDRISESDLSSRGVFFTFDDEPSRGDLLMAEEDEPGVTGADVEPCSLLECSLSSSAALGVEGLLSVPRGDVLGVVPEPLLCRKAEKSLRGPTADGPVSSSCL